MTIEAYHVPDLMSGQISKLAGGMSRQDVTYLLAVRWSTARGGNELIDGFTLIEFRHRLENRDDARVPESFEFLDREVASVGQPVSDDLIDESRACSNGDPEFT